MRLDKLLANEGFGSRKDVKKLIKKGAVTIDEAVIKDVSYHVDPTTSDVIVSGVPIIYQQYAYIMLHKPQGVISATEDDRHEVVTDLLDPYYDKFHLFPVGRLDRDTEGLLLLTNDGQLAHRLTSPKHKVDKQYEAIINAEVTEDDVRKFQAGVTLDDGYVTKPAHLDIAEQSEYESKVYITITEGKYHQIKRMFQAVDKEVVYLKRLAMGSLTLDDELALGEARELTDVELNQLLETE
ncbi:16S rRNA pseudouridine516 synthase [Alkalibacillus flavidus]|uniref:Pseudouridine synthase n=1 Tax=Alkalibacillus flavidus TaxID=546021 RepID=A0ABV2KVG3_9BACI